MREQPNLKPHDQPTRRLVLAALFALGVSAVVSQLVLFREMFSAFGGNEMILGVLLGNWLLLSATGAWLSQVSWRSSDTLKARRQKPPPEATWQLHVGVVVVAVLPLLQVAALRVLRDVMFQRGVMVSWGSTMMASALLLAPLCVLSGYMLMLGVKILSRREPLPSELPGPVGLTPARLRMIPEDAVNIGRVYVADALGSVLGGALFSFVLMRMMGHMAALCVPAVLGLAVALAMAWRWRSRTIGAVAAVAMALLVLVPLLDSWTTRMQFAPVPVLFRTNSPYGRIVVTASKSQINFMENGVPVFSTENTEEVETTVHAAMAQRPDARRVLLVGGGIKGVAREILRYDGVSVTYVELDPALVETVRRFAPDALADPRIQLVTEDGRQFVRQTKERFDVVIVDMPPPSTTLLNRYYTAEFYEEVRRVLNEDGVLAFSLGRYENYVSVDLARLFASAQRTLQTSFGNVLLLPLGRVVFLASDGDLTTHLAEGIAARGVKAKLMSEHFLNAVLTPDRLDALQVAADSQKALVNEDFSPALYHYYLQHWMSRQSRNTALITALALAAALIVPFAMRAGAVAVFTGGFAATALEIVLLLAVQVLCGSMYRQIGVVVTAFMVGLAVGGWVANRAIPWSRRVTMTVLALLIAALAGFLPLCLDWMRTLSSGSAEMAVTGLMFVVALVVGMEFPVANQTERTEAGVTASRMYGADFLGAAVGALVASAVLIPLAGVAVTCWAVAGLNVLGSGLLWWERR